MVDPTYCESVFEHACSKLASGDELWCTVSYEQSDFARFNHAQIRQAGAVTQAKASCTLRRGLRQTAVSLSLCGDAAEDQARLAAAYSEASEIIAVVPEDPFAAFDANPRQEVSEDATPPPSAQTALAAMLNALAEHDLVGIWASGWMGYGVLSSLGHRLWHRRASWNCDWSVYATGDKAVKNNRAGFGGNTEALIPAMLRDVELLPILHQTPKVIQPGGYRAWLSPRAMGELLGMLNWGGFSERLQKTQASPLQRVVNGEQHLSPLVTLRQETAAGGGPQFTSQGHALPPSVTLIEAGAHANSMVSSRSAAEYGSKLNAAQEAASDLHCSVGTLAEDDILRELGTGIHVADCWYNNWSDRNACRITGMTRFHTFWVEQGEIVAPLSVMRFDDSLYRTFGSELIALGQDAQMSLSSSTYGGRSFGSSAMPGALVADWTLSL